MKAMRTIVSLILSGVWLAAATHLAAGDSPGAVAVPSAESQLVGIPLANGHLGVRIVDNVNRLNVSVDGLLPGYSGVASLVYTGQGRNIFAPAGLNYECCSTVPKLGRRADLWNAPRVAPMTMEQLDARTVRLLQKGAEAAGLNAEIVYHLGENYVDQTITTWPDADIESSHTIWASYMLFVQNTSLFLHGTLKDDPQSKWLEMTSCGHVNSGSGGVFNGSGGVFFRPFDPVGKAWYDFLTDNPVRRQAVVATPESRAATERAGFKLGEITSFDHFFFGFVDDYVALFIFRKPDNGRFTTWISASGNQALRRPAWDYAIESGPQKAGERRTFFVRLVYTPFAGVADVLKEVERFQTPGVP